MSVKISSRGAVIEVDDAMLKKLRKIHKTHSGVQHSECVEAYLKIIEIRNEFNAFEKARRKSKGRVS